MFTILNYMRRIIERLRIMFLRKFGCDCKTLLYIGIETDGFGRDWKVFRCVDCGRFMYQDADRRWWKGRFEI